MRSIYLLFLVLILGALGHYFYRPILPMCSLPVAYTIGYVDDRFGVSEAEAKEALSKAEAVWEDSLGRDDIFLYRENAPLKINFIYDERQRQAEEINRALDELSVRGDANEVLVELHRRLVSEYQAHEVRYEALRSAYEAKLDAYNREVESYNSNGGAQTDVYDNLERRRHELDREREEVNRLGATMNRLVDQINTVGEKGNELIRDYNERVHRFNHAFGHEHEFTQGDYSTREINVYSFSNERELVLVLAHELGHSLSIAHVENEDSIMYYLMGAQPDPLRIGVGDLIPESREQRLATDEHR
jgi:hypothetical protein